MDLTDAGTATLSLSVPSIHCMGCVRDLQRGLLRFDGVEEVIGDPTAKTLTVTYRRGPTSQTAIREEIVAVGHVVMYESGGLPWRA